MWGEEVKRGKPVKIKQLRALTPFVPRVSHAAAIALPAIQPVVHAA
jgi:hypothetical protein